MSLLSTKDNSPNKNQEHKIFSIEGNIGAGKSTFLNILDNNLKGEFDFFPENIESWRNVSGKNVNLLDMMYQDSERNGFVFQQYVLLTKLQYYNSIKNNKQAQTSFMERSVYCDQQFFQSRNVFMKDFELRKKQTPAEVVIHHQFSDYILKKTDYQIDGLIYLRSTPETCLQRCQKRCRDEEKCIDIEFLTQIHDRHEEWLMYKDYKGIPILVLDCNVDFLNDIQKQLEIIQLVQEFISKA